jgi:hypothetical protein
MGTGVWAQSNIRIHEESHTQVQPNSIRMEMVRVAQLVPSKSEDPRPMIDLNRAIGGPRTDDNDNERYGGTGTVQSGDIRFGGGTFSTGNYSHSSYRER